MIQEESVISQIAVDELGFVHVRRADRVMRSGALLVESFHRFVLEPGAALDGQDARVCAVAQAAWTADVLEAHRARVDADQRRELADLMSRREVLQSVVAAVKVEADGEPQRD